MVNKLQYEGIDVVLDVIDLMDSYYFICEDFDFIQEFGVGWMSEEYVKIEIVIKLVFI